MPDGRLFLAIAAADLDSPDKAKAIRTQITLLLTGQKWEYLWRDPKAGESSNASSSAAIGAPRETRPVHLLTRQLVTEEERKAARVKEGLERMHYLRDLAKDWPRGKADLEMEDPDLAAYLNSGWYRAGLSLLGSFPDDTLAQVLAGGTVQMTAAALSPAQMDSLKGYMNGQVAVLTDAQGNSREVFNAADVPTKGQVTLMPFTRDDSPLPDIRVRVTTVDPGHGAGGPLLQHPQAPEIQVRRDRAAKHQEDLANVALTQASGVDRVTIAWDAPTNDEKEPPLSAYLRSYAEQTGLSLLGRWPDPDKQAPGSPAQKLYRRRLSSSILHRPLGEALDTLCQIYHAQWRLEGHAIRFWVDLPESPKVATSSVQMRHTTVADGY